jgi:hypothetical protein
MAQRINGELKSGLELLLPWSSLLDSESETLVFGER